LISYETCNKNAELKKVFFLLLKSIYNNNTLLLMPSKGRVRVMGHTGPIVFAYGESAVEKVEPLKECAVII
jgi:hypothetical protein